MGGRGSKSTRSAGPVAGGTFDTDGIPTNRRFKDGKETTASASAIMAKNPEMGSGEYGKDPVRNANARQAMREGQREPIKANIDKQGKLHIINGRHRLQAAAEMKLPIRVKWYG